LRPLCGAREAHRHRLRALRAEGAAGALGAAEGGRAADGLAAHGAGEGAVEQRDAAGGDGLMNIDQLP